MKKNNNKNKSKASSVKPAKTTDEDSVDVSTANAENRFTWEDAKKGITDQGGNASADVRMKGGKRSDSRRKEQTRTPSKYKK